MQSVRQESLLPIARQPLHMQVANAVRDMIIEGHLAAGASVNESKLCADLGVSRTPMREAIRTLASEGLIVLRPGRSTMVRKFSADDVRGMLEVVAEMEALAGRRACTHASDTDIDAIGAVHREMLDHYQQRERLEYYKLNQHIHSLIVAASGNQALVEVHETLQSRMKRIRFTGNSAPEKWRAAVAEHEEMIDALTLRDGDRLAEVLHRHITQTWQRVSDAI